MHKVMLAGATRQARPLVIVVVAKRHEREYVPLRERVWDAESETFREAPERPEAA
jgi:hypothetical protein